MQCIDFKAELRNVAAARGQCHRLGGRLLDTLRIHDTYYRLADGRLKRTQIRGEPARWVFYHRADRVPPKLCTFRVLTDDQATTRWGARALPVWIELEKTREMWMVDQVRVHIDAIDTLGDFIEFETLVGRRHPVETALRAVADLRRHFAPILGEPVGASYADLIAQQAMIDRAAG